MGEDGDDQSVTPVKRRKQQEKIEGDIARSKGVLSTPPSPGRRGVRSSSKKPECAVGSPTRSTRCGRANPGRLRSAAVAASAAVASVVAGYFYLRWMEKH